MTIEAPATMQLTEAQRRIVDWGDGPLVVIAGAGSGKTRVIVERVRRLLETKGEVELAPDGSLKCSYPTNEASADEPFAGPLLPEQILVLTYNVKAARELGERIEAAVGPAARARIQVGNFHSFCHRVLTGSAPDAGLPSQPDVLDGVGQMLLLREIRSQLALVYHSGRSNPFYWLDSFVAFINRAKDELVTPADFEAWVDRERVAFEARFGPYDLAVERISAQGNLDPLREIRKGYADLRRAERAAEAGAGVDGPDIGSVEKVADREARRTVAGDGRAHYRSDFDPADHPRIDALAETYVADGAALEVLRLSELALVYRAYQEELARRGAIDFGEQISLVTRLFKRKPNVLRRYQRQFRYLLVDEFQDANIAQIELIELLGRTPDRPDNVMVVGDDDQSIYRFRGASYAAFVELDRRFSGPPAHDPGSMSASPPARLRLEENFRSVEPVLMVADRLILRNEHRYAPDKVLRATRGLGPPVELVVATDVEDEAREIVERIMAWSAWDPADVTAPRPDWSRYAVLYRKHRHREAIVDRLRDAGIPYTVVGGLSLFDTPAIRDLEQTLRAITDPHDAGALVRMMSSAPWRLDALEILRLTRMARHEERRLVEVVRDVVASGEVAVEAPDDEADVADAEHAEGIDGSADAHDGALTLGLDLASTAPADEAQAPARPAIRRAVAPETRAKLRRLMGTLEELAAKTWREGPFTILEEYVERTGVVFDLLRLDDLEARRTVADIGSLLRFARDWQAEHPRGTLGGFIDYLDAYQAAGGELPTSVEASEDAVGVQLMTLYQAKGLEFDHVFVPQLLKDEWPAREFGAGLFPADLLKEAVPAGDIHIEEERRLLYVALTRARERLVLTTVAGPAADKDPSLFLADIRDGAGAELVVLEGTLGASADDEPADDQSGPGADDEAADAKARPLPRVMPLPTPRERRLALRVRASEILELLEGIDPDDPEAAEARTELAAELAALADQATETAEEARARGLDPLTLRVVALDTASGSSLLDVAPLPKTFSYSQISTYERCPLQYALQRVYLIPSDRRVGAFTFGTTAHEAFERFTKERRERLARGEAAPTREDLQRFFEAGWQSTGYEGKTAEQNYRQRVTSLLDRFWEGEVSTIGQAVAEEVGFELTIEVPDGAPAVFTGLIDRIDRLPSGGIEVIDYKTGRPGTQKSVQESLQLSIYALACRDALGYGTPERVTLYFTEHASRMSATRSDEELDAARDELAAWVARVRSGDFTATPHASTCWTCDYQAICPERVR